MTTERDIHRRVAVTGVGIVTPLGIGAAAFWNALTDGRSAIGEIEGRTRPPTIAAELRDFTARDFIRTAHLRRMDKLSRMITAACRMALDETRIDLSRTPPEEIGIVIGSALGDIPDSVAYLDRLFTKGPAAASPMTFPNLVLNAPASYAAMDIGATGVNLTVAQGETSGEQAILLGCDLVHARRARVVLAGGGDELASLVMETTAAARALSGQRGGHEWCSPYDRARNGIVLGEGAAIVALEPLQQAVERGATVYAEIEDGLGFSVPAPRYDWPDDASAAVDAVRALLRDRVVDLVVGCGNSSVRLDGCEIDFALRLFGDGVGNVELTSIKGAVGEFGAAGALSTAAACLALHEQTVPPLCNLRHPPDHTSLHFAGPRGRRRPIERALVSGFARGGGGAALLLKRYEAANRG